MSPLSKENYFFAVKQESFPVRFFSCRRGYRWSFTTRNGAVRARGDSAVGFRRRPIGLFHYYWHGVYDTTDGLMESCLTGRPSRRRWRSAISHLVSDLSCRSAVCCRLARRGSQGEPTNTNKHVCGFHYPAFLSWILSSCCFFLLAPSFNPPPSSIPSSWCHWQCWAGLSSEHRFFTLSLPLINQPVLTFHYINATSLAKVNAVEHLHSENLCIQSTCCYNCWNLVYW